MRPARSCREPFGPSVRRSAGVVTPDCSFWRAILTQSPALVTAFNLGHAVQKRGTNPQPSRSNRFIPAPSFPYYWPLTTDNWQPPLDGRAVPALPCAGGLPPQRPPVYAGAPAPPQLPCQQPGSNAAMPAPFQPAADATVVKPTVPSRLQLAANAQPCRRPRACAAPAVRITIHESRPFGPFRPSLVRGDSPRNAPL